MQWTILCQRPQNQSLGLPDIIKRLCIYALCIMTYERMLKATMFRFGKFSFLPLHRDFLRFFNPKTQRFPDQVGLSKPNQIGYSSKAIS